MIHYFYGAIILAMLGFILWIKIFAKSTGKIKEYKSAIKENNKQIKNLEKEAKANEKKAKQNISGSVADHVASERASRRRKPRHNA